MSTFPQRSTCPSCNAVFRKARFRVCPRDGAELEPLPRDPLVGAEIGGRYRIEKVLADGVRGRLYQARGTQSGERFAVEMMYGDLAGDERQVRRFLREARLAGELHHPNLVPVVDSGRTPAGVPFLVRGDVGGRSLERTLDDQGTVSQDRAVGIAADLCRGLGHLHERGLVHRALQPAHVVLVQDGERESARISGFARAVPAGSSVKPPRRGKIPGQPAYLAPEEALGDPLDGRSDLFALGVLLYRMLTGSPPFTGRPIAVLMQTLHAPVPPMRQVVSENAVDERLERLVARLLAKSPENRPASAGAVLEILSVAD